MKIKYAGPKVIFTKHGIDFDNNKDDKYVYLNIAIQLLQAIDHDHTPGETYAYDTSSKRLNDDEILNFVQKRFGEGDKFFEIAKDDARKYIDHERTLLEKQKHLLEEAEASAWENNIDIMTNYVIQRHFNKSVYYAIIEELCDVLKNKKIYQLNTPMFQKFIHVQHTIQGVLKRGRNPIRSSMEIHNIDGNLTSELRIQA